MSARSFRLRAALQRVASRLAVVCTALGLCATGAGAAERLSASDGQAGDALGRMVALWGDTLLAGAPEDDDQGTSSGSVYVFAPAASGGWFQRKLKASDGSANGRFGYGIDIAGDLALIGADGKNAAYVFQRNGSLWSQIQKIPGPDGAGDAFGIAVALGKDGGAVIGAENEGQLGAGSGAAYVYRWNGTSFAFVQKLVAADGGPGDNFGTAVAIDGDRIVVGADQDAPAGADSGSAYVFAWNGTSYAQQQKLVASNAAAGLRFASTLALEGDLLLENTGHVFRWNGSAFAEEAQLTPSDHSYTRNVAIHAGRAFLGMQRDDALGTDAGSVLVYQFDGTGWVVETEIHAPDGAPRDHFGAALDVSGHRLLVGARLDDAPAADSGSAYIVELAPHKLIGSEVAGGFGMSVSVDGGVAMVGGAGNGAHLFRADERIWREEAALDGGWAVAVSADLAVSTADGGLGAVDVYRWSGTSWAFEQQIVPSDPGVFFGWSVAADADTIAVGDPVQGTIHVFRWDDLGWVEEQTLVGHDTTASDQFGMVVGVSGDAIIVGVPEDDAGGAASGSAYVFERSGTSWSEVAKLVPSDAGVGDRFGSSVAVSGDRALVGAPGDDDAGPESGSVYSYLNAGSWAPMQKLVRDASAAQAYFGSAVALSSDGNAVVGSSNRADVYTPFGTGWLWKRTLLAGDDAANGFGSAVAIDGNDVIVGAPQDDARGENAGAAYAFGIVACSDGIDNDGDEVVDFPADPGCSSAFADSEGGACEDGIDNDANGRADYDGAASRNGGVARYLSDAKCANKPWAKEGGCGFGAEAALLLPLFRAARRRLR